MIYGTPTIVTNGLVLNLDAANTKSYVSGSTTWRDLSGNNNSGSLVNGPTFNNGNGGSIVFDGTDDYINLQKDTDFPIGGNARTVSVWFKTPSVYPGGTKLPCLFAYGTSDFTKGFAVAWEGRQSNAFINQYRILLTNYGNQSYNNTALSLNTIYNITLTKLTGSETYNFYLNGNIDGANTWTNPNAYQTTNTVLNGTATLGTSTQSPGNMYWAGNIFQANIYNRALSQQEIAQNYNALKSRYGLS